MHPRPDNFHLFTVLWLGVAVPIVALAGLWLETRRGPRSSRVLEGVLFLALLLVGGSLWVGGQPSGVTIPFLALAVACLAAWAAHPVIFFKQEDLLQKAIRIAGPDAACKCHGWVFTGGQFGVASEDVDAILADNGYLAVSEPRENDVVIYRDDLGRVRHTGLVRFVGADGLVLVESKWGPLGLYLHPPQDQPYGTFFNYYHSPRPGNELRLVSGPAP
jgi:hypothetical protein